MGGLKKVQPAGPCCFLEVEDPPFQNSRYKVPGVCLRLLATQCTPSFLPRHSPPPRGGIVYSGVVVVVVGCVRVCVCVRELT